MNQFLNTSSNYNVTTSPLSNGESYTGQWEDVDEYSEVRSYIKTDQKTVLKLQFSPDGNTVDSELKYEASAGVPDVHRLAVTRPFFRLVITNNSGSDQTYLRAGVLLNQGNGILSSPINLSLSQYSDAIGTRPTNFIDEAILGRRSGVRAFFKFGYRNGLTASSGEETVWATTGNFTQLATASTFTIAYTNTGDGSTATGARSLYFQYIDSNGRAAIAVHTLGSSGTDVTSFSGLGINRVAVSATGSAIYNNNDITITATTGGTKQAFIPAQNSVTQQAIYHVANNAQAVVQEITLNSVKLSGGGSAQIEVKAYAYSRLVSTRYEVFRTTLDTSVQASTNLVKPIGFLLSGSDTLVFVANTDTNSTALRVRFSLLEYENIVS